MSFEYESVEHEYRGISVTITIESDDYPTNPLEDDDGLPSFWIHDNAQRDWSYLNTTSIWDYVDEEAWNAREERRYERAVKSGTSERQAYRESWTLASIAEAFERETRGIALILYGYDHSGQSISAVPFTGRAHHAGWDSGPIGIVFMTGERIRERMLWGRITKARREQMAEYMMGDVKVVDEYVRGEVKAFRYESEDGSISGSLGDRNGYTVDELLAVAVEDVEDGIDGHFDDIEQRRVVRLAEQFGRLFKAMWIAGVENDALVDRVMTRITGNVSRLPAWRRPAVHEALVREWGI